MGPYLAQPITQKHTKKGDNLKLKLKYSFCEMQGWRRTMQDAAILQLDIGNNNSLFGVFDGHGGFQVAKYVEKIFVQVLTTSKFYKEQKYKEALIQTFMKVDQMIVSEQGEEQLNLLRKNHDANSGNQKISYGTGCTANVVLITPTKIFVANAGDSRSVLCRKGNSTQLSFDHKPQDPTQINRIQSAGGSIVNGRVNGGLNLTRSLGDFTYKSNRNLPYTSQLITCHPDISQTLRSSLDQFILIGCDGIWEKYLKDTQGIVTRVWNQRKSGNDGVVILKGVLDGLLAKEVGEGLGCDNMTLVMVEFL